MVQKLRARDAAKQVTAASSALQRLHFRNQNTVACERTRTSPVRCVEKPREQPRRLCPHGRCELDTSFCSNDSLGRPHLHSPSLACRVFLIKKPYSSKLDKPTTTRAIATYATNQRTTVRKRDYYPLINMRHPQSQNLARTVLTCIFRTPKFRTSRGARHGARADQTFAFAPLFYLDLRIGFCECSFSYLPSLLPGPGRICLALVSGSIHRFEAHLSGPGRAKTHI